MTFLDGSITTSTLCRFIACLCSWERARRWNPYSLGTPTWQAAFSWLQRFTVDGFAPLWSAPCCSISDLRSWIHISSHDTFFWWASQNLFFPASWIFGQQVLEHPVKIQSKDLHTRSKCSRRMKMFAMRIHWILIGIDWSKHCAPDLRSTNKRSLSPHQLWPSPTFHRQWTTREQGQQSPHFLSATLLFVGTGISYIAADGKAIFEA